MCGQFALISDLAVLVEAFDIGEATFTPPYRPHVRPGQPITALIREGGDNRLQSFQWGFIPAWARDPVPGRGLINARAETVAEKPSFRNAFRKGRCLILADGFYEWRKEGKTRTPFYISLQSGRPFGLAGLYETRTSPQHPPLTTCAIITTDANELIRPIHDRMPAIIPQDHQVGWLSREAYPERELLALLKPYPAGEMALREGLSPP